MKYCVDYKTCLFCNPTFIFVKLTKKRVLYVKKLKEYRYAVYIVMYALVYMFIFALLEKRTDVTYHIIHSPLDDFIPFCEYFIVPYYLWFLYMISVVFYFVVIYRNPLECRKLLTILCSGMTIFLIISYFYPNGLQLRPDFFERNNIFTELVSMLYKTDTSTNVLPSIHVYNSICLYMAIINSERFRNKKTFCFCNFILTASIILSTMLLKQHSVVDVGGAFLLYTVLYVVIYKKVAYKQVAHVEEIVK